MFCMLQPVKHTNLNLVLNFRCTSETSEILSDDFRCISDVSDVIRCAMEISMIEKVCKPGTDQWLFVVFDNLFRIRAYDKLFPERPVAG